MKMNAYCDTCDAKENRSETSSEHLQPYVLKISNFIFYFINEISFFLAVTPLSEFLVL